MTPMCCLALQEDSVIAWARFRDDYKDKHGVECAEELRPFVLCGFWMGCLAALKNKDAVEATVDQR